jgi:cobalt-zinc-cadmium efflux system protein
MSDADSHRHGAEAHGSAHAHHTHAPGAHGHHDHNHGRGLATHALAWAMALTLGYAAVEFVSGWWFGSLALVSDAGHMASDAAALGLAWFAAWLSRRPAGSKHSFGLARAEVIAAFLNGLALLIVVVLITVEAIKRLMHPGTDVQGLGVMVVAFFGLLLNLAVAFVLTRGEASLNKRAALLHVLGDLLGSFAAVLAGAVIHFTGWKPIDPILSLVIAVLILLSTLHLLREALHVLMEGVPRYLRLDEVGRTLAQLPEVRDVHDLHIWNISSGQIALSAHIRVDRLDGWPLLLSQARRILHERFGIEHVTLQPELAGAGGGGEQSVIQLVRRR